MKVLICGSRAFNDYELLKKVIRNPKKISTIITGCAKGADMLAIRYALEHNIPIEKYPAEWDVYGKSAGIRRNIIMVNKADAILAFWDGKSKGTKFTIDYAIKSNKYIKVIRF